MFRTVSLCLLLLCLMRISVAQQPTIAQQPAVAPSTSAKMAAHEIKLSTWCRFNAGPSAGSTRNLAPQPAQPVGSACHDQDGNSGVIVEIHTTKAKGPHPLPMPTPPPPAPPVTAAPPTPGASSLPPSTDSQPPKTAGDTAPPLTQPATDTSPEDNSSAKPSAGDTEKTGGESTAPAASSVESSYGERVGNWYKQLKQGSIEYNVPRKMVWKVASTVTVVIHGYQAPKTNSIPEATGSGTLKVSDRMKVKLLCPDHPDEFTITNEDSNDDVRYVPADSTTTWRWRVTPNYPAKGQKLVVQAWVLYPDQEEKYAQELPVYTATLDVDASLVTNAARGFWSEPGNWVKYMLPGGAGFLFLAGLIAWAKKKFEKPQAK